MLPAWTRDTQQWPVCAQGVQLGELEKHWHRLVVTQGLPTGLEEAPPAPCSFQVGGSLLPGAWKRGCSLPKSLCLSLKLLLAGHTVSVAILGCAQPHLSAH